VLVLTRKQKEQVVIGLGDRTIVVRVVSVEAGKVRLGITAPDDVAVHREETWTKHTEWRGIPVNTADKPESA
jgi:carbon storage regulator